MKLFCEEENYKLYSGSMLDLLEDLEENSIDSIVTDPPYELNFMNKGWDNSGIAFQKETWEKCLAVLKPGGFLLAFGGSRTFHRIACAIEDAGFEIQDTIMWLYGSGMPKSMSIGKSVESKVLFGSANKQAFKDLSGEKAISGNWGISKNTFEYGARPIDYSADGHEYTTKVDYQTELGKKWDGFGTRLKPAYEPIIVARKPCDGSITDNVIKWGCGALNIDECRIPHDESLKTTNRNKRSDGILFDCVNTGFRNEENYLASADPSGRFPANVILTYDETDEQEVCGGMPDSKGSSDQNVYTTTPKYSGNALLESSTQRFNYQSGYNDDGSAARYFYCAKASRRDRDDGTELVGIKNNHPTVKPCALMAYLVRLVTPKGGTILDPFNGSGSTGKAVMWENKERAAGYFYIGVDLEENYLNISKARIDFAINAEKIAEEEFEQERKKIVPGKVLDMFAMED